MVHHRAPIDLGIERLPPEQKAVGSNPTGGTEALRILLRKASLSQAVASIGDSFERQVIAGVKTGN